MDKPTLERYPSSCCYIQALAISLKFPEKSVLCERIYPTPTESNFITFFIKNGILFEKKSLVLCDIENIMGCR